MTLPVTPPTVGETYTRIRAKLIALKAWCTSEAAALAAPVRCTRIRDEIIPELRDASLTVPASSNFPQTWIDALEAHAQAQMPGAVTDWVAAYDATGDAIRVALTAAVDAIPKDGNGYSLIEQHDAGGVLTVRTVTASALKAALEAVAASVA